MGIVGKTEMGEYRINSRRETMSFICVGLIFMIFEVQSSRTYQRKLVRTIKEDLREIIFFSLSLFCEFRAFLFILFLSLSLLSRDNMENSSMIQKANFGVFFFTFI